MAFGARKFLTWGGYFAQAGALVIPGPPNSMSGVPPGQRDK